jgi:hypothetical protein
MVAPQVASARWRSRHSNARARAGACVQSVDAAMKLTSACAHQVDLDRTALDTKSITTAHSSPNGR